ncbi:helix-turn-helix transcriptional regulator [Paractinoplanes durhamensis]|uniref:Transcriptional regulator n=1 Tax=Paractinoplanes durhamensis TaxID=113563 RepID=A0ABQ3Z513_9ACTN|nr:helix-turn-helix transcriptional regulator [Actinoplanes durhamensis]GIE04928.1 transcriptional regulator [Actinoplanes durhamensis]
MAESELGLFLRSRRETIAAHRNTPGLSRSEVAARAGVTASRLAGIEDGDEPDPPAPVLGALAAVLGLSASERLHLYRLTRRNDSAPPLEIRPTVREVLSRLEPAAAVLISRPGDLLAWTSGFQRLAGATGLLDGAPPNLNRYIFTDRRARMTFPDWDVVADLTAGSAAPEIAEELIVTAGPVFAGRSPTGPPAASGVLRWRHPAAGELQIAYETLVLPGDDGLHLVVVLVVGGENSEEEVRFEA